MASTLPVVAEILGVMRISKGLLAGVLASATLLIAACGPDSASSDETAAPGASDTAGGGDTGGGGAADRDDCLVGTWQLDVQDVADQLAALMGVPGVAVEADGPVTVVFDSGIEVIYETTLAITMPGGDPPMVGTAVYSGSQVSSDWTASDGVLTAVPGESDFTIDMSFSVGGETVPIDIPLPELGDLGGADATYTCSGDSATVTAPAPAPTWQLTRA